MTTPRWYMVNKMGMATLCSDKADAQQEAADAQRFWPHMGPHRAVQLVEAADVEAMRAGYDAARLEIESLRAALATPQPAPTAQGDALDAARLDWLLLRISGAEFRRIGVHYSGNASRAAVDAARKQGANHD